MKKILSLVLAIMLMPVPVSPVLATAGIEDDCHQYFTVDDVKHYIKNHALAGHTKHNAVFDQTRNDFDPKKECCNPHHKHKQLNPYIVVKDIYKMQYRCLDDIGNMWEVTIEEKIGRETGIYWNDKTLWADAVPDPCATSKRIYTYCLDDISNEKLIELFSCITRVDEYLDHTTESKIIEDLATEFVGGASGIAGALVTIAKYGGKIPYIGEVILVGVGVASSVYTLIKVTDEIHKIDVMKSQLKDIVMKMR